MDSRNNQSTQDSLNLWVEEITQGIVSIRFKVKNHLFTGKSEFQKVDIVDTYGFGKILLNDGLMMLSERDEFSYHDMIAHPALFVHPNPKRVLVIGGGDGGTAREVLRHANVEKCVMVEIDKMVVDACIEHIPQTSQVLRGHERLELRIDDGVKYVKESPDKSFDVILIDSTDPIGPATPLFGKDFYSHVHRILADDGIVVAQGESPFHNQDVQQSMLGVMRNFFPKTYIYNFSNLTYPGGLWSFSMASKSLCPVGDFNPKRVLESDLKFEYYSPAGHKAAFAIPEFQKRSLSGLLTEIKDC